MLRLMREEFGLTPAEAREAAGPGPKRAKGKIAEKLKLDGSAGNKGRVHFVGREQVGADVLPRLADASASNMV